MSEHQRLTSQIQAVANAPYADPLDPRVSEESLKRLIQVMMSLPEPLLVPARPFRDFGVVGLQWDTRGQDFVVILSGPTYDGIAVHIVGKYRWHGYLHLGEDIPEVFLEALARIAGAPRPADACN